MSITSSKALQYLQAQKDLYEKEKADRQEKSKTKKYAPNEYGFYTMRQCYIINTMIKRGVSIDANGLFYYTNKDKKTNNHHITDMTAYNISCDYYESLRQLGIKNCIELLHWDDDTIELIRKIGGTYYKTTIDEKGIIDEPWNGKKELLQFIRV